MRDVNILREHIISNPDTNGLTPAAVAELYTTTTNTIYRQVKASLAYKYLIKKSKWEGIEEAALDKSNPAHIAAFAAVKLVAGPDLDIDFSDATATSLLDALLLAGLISLSDKETIIALSGYDVSLAESVGWGGVSVGELSEWIVKVGVAS